MSDQGGTSFGPRAFVAMKRGAFAEGVVGGPTNALPGMGASLAASAPQEPTVLRAANAKTSSKPSTGFFVTGGVRAEAPADEEERIRRSIAGGGGAGGRDRAAVKSGLFDRDRSIGDRGSVAFVKNRDRQNARAGDGIAGGGGQAREFCLWPQPHGRARSLSEPGRGDTLGARGRGESRGGRRARRSRHAMGGGDGGTGALQGRAVFHGDYLRYPSRRTPCGPRWAMCFQGTNMPGGSRRATVGLGSMS